MGRFGEVQEARDGSHLDPCIYVSFHFYYCLNFEEHILDIFFLSLICFLVSLNRDIFSMALAFFIPLHCNKKHHPKFLSDQALCLLQHDH